GEKKKLEYQEHGEKMSGNEVDVANKEGNCGNNDVNETYIVGRCCLNGMGSRKDKHEALIHHQNSADTSHSNKGYKVGSNHESGIDPGNEEKKDEETVEVYDNNVVYIKVNDDGGKAADGRAYERCLKDVGRGNVNERWNRGFCHEYEIEDKIDECQAFKCNLKSDEATQDQSTTKQTLNSMMLMNHQSKDLARACGTNC
ncbi:14308_t:CDS:1, partial [Ambispora leptoticha]